MFHRRAPRCIFLLSLALCWLWRKNPEKWTEREEQRWDQLKDKLLVTGLAYAMRLELQKAYASASARAARSRLVKWSQWVRLEAEAVIEGGSGSNLDSAHIAFRIGIFHVPSGGPGYFLAEVIRHDFERHVDAR
jgi:hypothetical protein